MRVPRGRAMARVTLRLPADAPFATNDVQINATHVTVRRGESVVAHVPLEQPLMLIRAVARVSARRTGHAARLGATGED